jgi:hypothetical protein
VFERLALPLACKVSVGSPSGAPSHKTQHISKAALLCTLSPAPARPYILSPALVRPLNLLSSAGAPVLVFAKRWCQKTNSTTTSSGLHPPQLFSSRALIPLVVIVSAETLITIRQSIHMQTIQQQQFTWFTQKLGYVHQA